MPVYRLNGKWKNRQVTDYPVLLLQVGVRMGAEIDESNVAHIASSFSTKDFELVTHQTPLGIQIYFDVDQADIATRMRDRLRDVGYSDANFVGSSPVRYMTAAEIAALRDSTGKSQ